MSGFKGTPGPWVASKSDRSIGPVSKDDHQSYGMILPVAWVEFDDRPGRNQANANLISAAPELLEALQDIMNLQTRGFVVLGEKISEKAAKAIEKAMGVGDE